MSISIYKKTSRAAFYIHFFYGVLKGRLLYCIKNKLFFLIIIKYFNYYKIIEKSNKIYLTKTLFFGKLNKTARNGQTSAFMRRLVFGELRQEDFCRMYAIIENGSKQYTAKVGDVIRFEKLNKQVGENVEFKVLLVSDENGIKVGKDAEGYKVVGEVLVQDKAKKVIVYKYKAKKNERKKRGHRQPFTAVKINEIAAL